MILKSQIFQFGAISLFAISGGQVNAENSCYIYICIIHGISQNNNDSLKPWPHRVSASASALMLPSILENGYDTDAWCGFYRYKSMLAITSVNADAQCGQGLNIEVRR